MLAKKTSKNQITLPKDIVKAFSDTDYFDVSIEDNRILLVPVKITPLGSTLESVRDKIGKLGLTEKDVGDAVRWARNRKR
ncbi:MAG TPA: AbrB/MazE/SpoVT family DNA-binding domain-containing protein [Thermodesulfobacteriota bacterium]|nr:AbrB/MazE/SpoVT family DNA-binding domain-containing protein [Thermodesulfobacteriota bacterium]